MSATARREAIMTRLLARLAHTRDQLRQALAGYEAERLYIREFDWPNPGAKGSELWTALGAEGYAQFISEFRARAMWVQPIHGWQGFGYEVPFTVLYVPKLKTQVVFAPATEEPLSTQIGELPRSMTVGEGLAMLDTEADSLLEKTSDQIETLLKLVAPKLRTAVLARDELITRWPWPRDSHPVACVMELLRANMLRHTQQPIPGAMATWPPEVAPLDVAQWAALVKTYPEEATQLRERLERHDDLGMSAARWTSIAVLYAALQAVERDRDRRAMAIDAGRPHHDLLMGWRDLPKDTHTPHQVTTLNDRIELLAPGGGCVQLTLDLDGQGSPSEALITALREMRGWKGLRHWAAVQKLLSVDGGRLGWVRWTLDGHLDALSVSVKNRSKADVRAQVARQVEAFTKIEIAVYAEDGTLRTRRPILLVGAKYDRLTGSDWELDGMQLTINPLLYAGVREDGGKLGRNWHPAPVELAAVNEREHPYTLALGLILPIRWRLALAEGHDHLTLTGESALRLAGITYKPQDRQWLTKNGAHAWEALERDLAELARIGGLGRWEWDAADTPRTLAGRLHLWSAPWMADRTLHAVRPRELPPGPAVLTGAELKAWRTRHGLTQATAAEKLRVSRPTIARAEALPLEPLSTALAEKLRTSGA